MYEDNKKLAEAMLSYLCKGEGIEGVRFGASLQMLLSSHSWIDGQTYLNLVSRWTIFDSYPDKLPDSEFDLLEVPLEEQLLTIYSIRETKIVDVRLGKTQPHLIITFEDGKVLFLNGRHELYETWQFGIINQNPTEYLALIAMPGGDVAVWIPQSVMESLNQGKQGGTK